MIPIRVGPTPRIKSGLQPVLSQDRIRYVGEPIAVVVADSHEIARDAADDVVVDIVPGEVFAPSVVRLEAEAHPEDFLIPWAARKVRRPVRSDKHRRPHFLAINHSGKQHYQIRPALTAKLGE